MRVWLRRVDESCGEKAMVVVKSAVKARQVKRESMVVGDKVQEELTVGVLVLFY